MPALLVGTLGAAGVHPPGAPLAGASATPPARGSLAPDARASQALRHGPVDVLMAVDPTSVTARLTTSSRGGGVTRPDAARTREAARGFAALEQRALAPLGSQVTTVRDFPTLPVRLVRVRSRQALDALTSTTTALRMPRRHRLQTVPAHLALINQPAALVAGRGGAGVQVAVVDTGADPTLPGAGSTFGTCANGPGTPGCRIIRHVDVTRSGHLDVDPEHHGTNVTGVVAAVAPEATLAVYNVFSGDAGTGELGAWDTDVLAALDDVAAQAAAHNTRAVNLSLGSADARTSECADSVYAAVFSGLRAQGVLPVVSAGNAALDWTGRFRSGVSEPACAPGALRVGAVYPRASSTRSWGWWPTCTDRSPRPDTIPCFSQTGRLLGLLAPGVDIAAAGVTLSGTSQAAPHVAGAVATLAGTDPRATPDMLEQVLRTTGPPVRDPRDGTTVPRLDLTAAGDAVAGGATLRLTPTTGRGTTTVTLSGIAPPGSRVLLQRKDLGSSDSSYRTLRAVDAPTGIYRTSVVVTRSSTFRARSGSTVSAKSAVRVTSTVAFSKDRALGGGRYLLRANGGPNGARGTLRFYLSTSSGLKRIGTVVANTSGVGSLTWRTSRGTKKVRVYYDAPGCRRSGAATRTVRVL